MAVEINIDSTQLIFFQNDAGDYYKISLDDNGALVSSLNGTGATSALPYVSISGDTMTGDLNMGAFNIIITGTTWRTDTSAIAIQLASSGWTSPGHVER